MPQMPQAPDWKRVLEAGMQFTEMRRSQARALAADLVAQGHLARDQMAATVDELLEMSRRRTDDLRKIVQSEVQRQLGSLGLATKADLAALERRLTKATREAKKAPAKKAAASEKPKKAGAKKAAEKRKAG
jgi:polyhydroxyalkanoate synthesis regulator phasin